jgi:hypothetical protein
MAIAKTMVRCACGEHFVASFLSGIDLVVALTRMGSPATDLFVMSEAGGKSIPLQIKTGGPDSHYVYKRKPVNNYFVWRTGAITKNWYVFVFVGAWPRGGGFPEVFFVPPEFVAQRVNENKDKGWFWMYDREAEQYRGLNGYEKLKDAFGG